MEICNKGTKTPIVLIQGHLYKYEEEEWYYIYGIYNGEEYFTRLSDGSMWKAKDSYASIDGLTDLTDQFCVKRK